MVAPGLEDVFRDLGIARVRRVVDRKISVRRSISCAQCNAHSDVAFKGTAPPVQVAQQFETRGWTRKGRTWTCPMHGDRDPVGFAEAVRRTKDERAARTPPRHQPV